MNAKAAALGMTHRAFRRPDGLVERERRESRGSVQARDRGLAQLRHPRVFHRPELHRARAPALVEFRNTDNLVANPAWNIIVQKTGYIAEAGKCLVMEAVIEGRNVVIVLLDSLGKYTRVADAKRVKSWMEAVSARRVVSMR